MFESMLENQYPQGTKAKRLDGHQCKENAIFIV